MIDEANEIAKQLEQNVTFSFGLTGNKLGDKGINVNLSNLEFDSSSYDIEIKVNNLNTEEQYIWDRTKFNDRLMVMRDFLNIYEESGNVDEIAKEGNPFLDVREPAIIGQGYFRLEPLSFLIDNPVQIELIGTNYENHGKLEVNVVPVDTDGNDEIPDEQLPDAPEDLLDRRIDYQVQIIRATDLPSNFCKDVFVEYQIYLNEQVFRTESIEGKSREPEFNYSKQHT